MVRNLNPKRIVLKIGTSTLAKGDGMLDYGHIRRLIDEIVSLKKKGKEIVIVTSGAIGAGCAELGIKSRVRDIKMRQATAAIGQSLLMQHYHDAFAEHKTKVAQILLTYEDFSDRKTYLNLRNSLNTLLRLGVVPIINENDPISINEIGPSFGDNDKLSALVASKLDANLLIMMSDIGGLYTKDPSMSRDAKLVNEVVEVTPEIESASGKAGSTFAVGGMRSKIEAVKKCMKAGVFVVICNGKDEKIVSRIINNEEIGTLFIPDKQLKNKKRWINEAKSKGSVVVDEGAEKALRAGKNLLPVGIKNVRGIFESGDVVDINCNNQVFAKAIIDYSSEQLVRLKGKKSPDVKKVLGHKGYENITRRENLLIL